MFGIDCGGNSLGMGCLVVLNFHFVFEVVLVIVHAMSIRGTSSEEIEKFSWMFSAHMIVWICLICAFCGIFNDKPFLMIPQIALQTFIVTTVAVNVLSWIYLSHVQILVLTELRDLLPKHTNIDYVHLYVKIVLGCLFVALYFCFLTIVYGYFKQLRNETRFKKAVSKSATLSEDMIL